MTAKVTRADTEKGATRSFKTKSGNHYEIRDLNFYQAMKADGLATDDTGMPVLMEIPYIRALTAIVSMNEKPFGPIRTKIDVQKWAERIPGSDTEELMENLRKFDNVEPETLKNS